MKKKISKEELKDILHDEEIKARWESISNSETIRKAEKDEKFWKEHLDPFYDEMFPHTPTKAVSDVVRKEMEEYNNPVLKEFDDMLMKGMTKYMIWAVLWSLIGLLFAISMITAGTEESCLSC